MAGSLGRAAAGLHLFLTDQWQDATPEARDLLDAQRSLYTTEQTLVQTKLLQLQNQVSLYRVLGGGWTEMGAAPRS